MKKVLLIWLLAANSFGSSFGQNNLPPAYEIKIDTAFNITLDDAYWQVLEDPKGQQSFPQITQSPLAEKFHENNTKKRGIDYSIRAYWVRYRFRNSMNHEAKITIPKNVTEADLYARIADENWNHKRTGTVVPWSKRDDLERIAAVTYIIPPEKELLIYERNNFDYDTNMPGLPTIRFGFSDRVIQEKYFANKTDILPSILFGFLILAALFNIYFFLIIRERVYLLFSLMLLSRAIASFLYDTDLFFREHPKTEWYLTGILTTFYFFFWIHFVRYFLKTFEHFPRWDKFLIGLSIYSIIVWTLFLTHITHNEEPGFGIMMFITFITFLLFIRASNKTIRWRIVAVLPAIGIISIPLYNYLFTQLDNYSGRSIPSYITWLYNNFSLLEQIALIWLLLFFSWSLIERYQQLQKRLNQEALAKERLAREKEIERSRLIAQQKVELEKQVTERTSELKQSLKDLEATQSQLIQSEKMASLGELTAGIAHEIQNPLNFVNNFSEVNRELIDEMEEALRKDDKEEAITIASDIKENLEKINHHGKRADAIVKGMLQHSGVSTGQKEPTVINALTDEYLRLSYHGLSAKDKTFNATLKTNFDENTGKVNIVPQDMGRVLLNLFNNAFYAVTEKKKKSDKQYEPTVTVTTKKLDDKIEIWVRDNGVGIPQKLVDKIFQPFFTTKPTGQGTGLGLSLSYDIIKAHGGEIKVETKEGEGAEFVIMLSLKENV